MPGVFISYRREDSFLRSQRLYDGLVQQVGEDEIFIDVDTLEPGWDYVERIEKEVGNCDVLLAVIGDEWASVEDSSGKRRLDDPQDFVRREIAAALRRNVRVIPLLVGGAVMPQVSELPEDLLALSRRNAMELSDKHWHHDVQRLVRALGSTGTREQEAAPAPEAVTEPREPSETPPVVAAPGGSGAPPVKRTLARRPLLAAIVAVPVLGGLAALLLIGGGGGGGDGSSKRGAPAPPSITRAEVRSSVDQYVANLGGENVGGLKKLFAPSVEHRVLESPLSGSGAVARWYRRVFADTNYSRYRLKIKKIKLNRNQATASARYSRRNRTVEGKFVVGTGAVSFHLVKRRDALRIDRVASVPDLYWFFTCPGCAFPVRVAVTANLNGKLIGRDNGVAPSSPYSSYIRLNATGHRILRRGQRVQLNYSTVERDGYADTFSATTKPIYGF